MSCIKAFAGKARRWWKKVTRKSKDESTDSEGATGVSEPTEHALDTPKIERYMTSSRYDQLRPSVQIFGPILSLFARQLEEERELLERSYRHRNEGYLSSFDLPLSSTEQLFSDERDEGLLMAGNVTALKRHG